MQSKNMNGTVFVILLLLFNGMVVAVARPFNLLGIFVMIVTEITLLLVALRVLRKQIRH